MLRQLQEILPHLTQAYNVRWRVSSGDTAGKREAKYNTVRAPLPDNLFREHFEGVKAVSVQPIRDDGETCQWGAIDIDSYGESNLLDQVREAMRLFQIPGYVELSKSGGVHIYFFLTKPVMAKPFRRALKKLAVWIGHPQAEIRPAQDQINVSEGDVGSFIVLPGFGIGLEAALELFQSNQVTPEQFNAITEEGDFIDGPPCLYPLQRLNERRGDWSQRNLFLYQLAVFFRYKFPSDWQRRLREYNEQVIRPSLSPDEVEPLITQLEKNARCHYRCKDEPFAGVCNKGACTVRKYGVAAREGVASLISAEGVTVIDTDPPTWFVTLQNPSSQDTVRVKLTTAQLQSVAAFKKRCIEVLKIIPTLPPQAEWEAVIGRLLENVEVVPVPFEMTEEARVLDLLYKFCLTSVKTGELEGLLRGRVFVEQSEDGIGAKFRLIDFISFLERYKYKGVATKDMYSTLQELARGGHVRMEKVSIAPLTLDVWHVDIKSRYLELKLELDMKDQS